MARGQRTLRTTIDTHRLAIKLGAAAAAVLLIMTGWLLISRAPQAAQPAQAVNTAAVCAYADASFCPAEAHYRTLIAAQAVSDILESQEITPHVCDPRNANDQYCAGASSGFTMPLYQIVVNHQSQLFTRNSGIAYLRSFFMANGVPAYQATNPGAVHGAIVMVFTSQATKARLLLHFTAANGGWQFAYPETVADTTP